MRARDLLWVAAALTLLSAPAGRAAVAPPIESWCGSSAGSDLPYLWQDLWLEMEALEAFSQIDAWTNAPGRVNQLLNKFGLLQRGSVRQGRETMDRARTAAQSLFKLRPQIVDAANTRNVPAYTQAVTQVRQVIQKLRSQYPSGALLPNPGALSVGFLLPGRPTLMLNVVSSRLVANQPAEVKLRLRDANGAGVGSLDLLDLHTRRLHVFAIDPSLEDYHHEHPITSGRPGEFSFFFTPQRAGDYLLWLDVTPAATGRNELLRATVQGSVTPPGKPRLETRLETVSDGWQYELRLNPETVHAGQVVEARLRVADDKGRPCLWLEPWMGAFAHVVGFHAEGKTMLHVHSHGEPPHELMRGGPVVPFRFVLPQAGHWILFIQTQVNGRVSTARFGFPVQ